MFTDEQIAYALRFRATPRSFPPESPGKTPVRRRRIPHDQEARHVQYFDAGASAIIDVR